jgi:hypothetical protein
MPAPSLGGACDKRANRVTFESHELSSAGASRPFFLAALGAQAKPPIKGFARCLCLTDDLGYLVEGLAFQFREFPWIAFVVAASPLLCRLAFLGFEGVGDVGPVAPSRGRWRAFGRRRLLWGRARRSTRWVGAARARRKRPLRNVQKRPGAWPSPFAE